MVKWAKIIWISFVMCISYEQAHFTVTMAGYTGFWWIGLRAKGSDFGGVDYIWDNGAPMTFSHWDRNQPGEFGLHNRVIEHRCPGLS